MESAIPREIVNACGCLEKNNGRALRGWGETGDMFCHARDLEIIKPADKSALDALGVKIFECHIRDGL